MSDKIDNYKFYKNVSVHQCNIADKINFFEGSSNYANEINKAFLNMFCIDDLSEIMLFGNENTDDCQMITLTAAGYNSVPLDILKDLFRLFDPTYLQVLAKLRK